jgi:FG-GAP-like repeat
VARRRRLATIVAITIVVLASSTLSASGATATFTGSVAATGTSFRSHAFGVEQAGTIRASLGWTTVSADLNLMLFDPSGQVVVGAYSTSQRPETISFNAVTVGTWRLGVKAKSGTTSYALSVEYPDPLSSSLSAVDRAASSGIAQVTRSYGTYVRDFDRDGDQDFLYNRHFGFAMRLYANDGSGHFTLRSNTAFPVNDRHDCVWAPLDQNDRPDLYCAVGASGGKAIKANELWLQQSDGSFGSVPGAWGATDPYGRGREPALFDVDNDGLLDLFVGNHFPRTDGQATPNRFYVQGVRGSFTLAPGYGINQEIGGQCAEPEDFDNDGFTDLMVCAYGQSGALKLYRNIAGGNFTNVAPARGVTGQWCDATWVHLNGDGRPDLAMMNYSWFRIMLQRPDGSFGVVYQRSMGNAGCRFGAGGNRIAAGDVNRDGAPDLYVLYSGYQEGSYNLPDVFLVNNGTGTGFATASLPQTTQGSGFSVAPIQADGDGPTEFLVTNGRGNLQGPIQLIDFAP